MRALRRKSDPVGEAAARLLEWAVARSRAPELYADMGTPDTAEGRFEALTFHVLLLVDRLNTDDPRAAALRQTLFDVFLRYLDGAMREMGVGDLAMGKRMRKLGEAIYGRAKSCELAFAALPDPAPLQALIARTVMADSAPDGAAELAHYLIDCREQLAARSIQEFFDGLVAPGERRAP